MANQRLMGLATVTLLAVSLGAAQVCPAQAPAGGFGNRQSRELRHPTTSPYLNLLRSQANGGGLGLGGIDTLPLDYYELVRPQQQFRSAIQRDQGALNQLRQRQNQIVQQMGAGQASFSQLGVTGHPTSFMNLGGYFSGGAGGAAGGGFGIGIGSGLGSGTRGSQSYGTGGGLATGLGGGIR